MKHSTRPPARHTKATRPTGEGPARARWEPTSAELDSEDAVAGLFDAYAERLHDYAATMLGDGQVAAEIVHDTLIDAIRRAPRLRDHHRLGAWLYAGIRLRLLRGHRSTVPVFDWTGQPRVHADVPAHAGVPVLQIRKLLEGVLGRLDHAERETLLLTRRHGLSGADLTAIFGRSTRDADRLVDTADARAAAVLAVEKLHSAGVCATTAATSAAAAVTTAATAPRQASEHVLSCAACLRRGHLTLDDLLTAPPIRAVPARLRGWVLHTATDPELEVYRADIAARGGALTDAGLPRQPDAPARLVRRAVKATAKSATGGGAAVLATAVMASGVAGVVLLPEPQRPSQAPLVISQPSGSGGRGSVWLAADPVTGRPDRTGERSAPAPSDGTPRTGEWAPSVPAPGRTAPNPGLEPVGPGAPAPAAVLPAPGLPAPVAPAPTKPPPNAPAPAAPAPAPRGTPPPRLLPWLLPAPSATPGVTVTTPPRLPVGVSVGVLPPLRVRAKVQVPALKIQANVQVPPLGQILRSPLPSALGILPVLHP